jgi:response regulator NasT
MRVLIADDDGLVAHQTGRVMRRLGHTIIGTAGTGRRAVEMARALQPDLALLDIVMPEMDGLEAARAILAEQRIPIVFITGNPSADLPSQVAALGAAGYVLKPVTETKLSRAIGDALARHQPPPPH